MSDRQPDDDTAHYAFNTAWGIPVEVFSAMVSQYPLLQFEFHSEEEQGWGAVMRGGDGQLVVMREWDIPNTHAERMENNGYCHCEEMREDEMEYMYEDCPPRLEAEDADILTSA